MNANAFRHFYNYHLSENRKIWDAYITPLSDEQFNQHADYSQGSVRNQVLHLINVDDIWFSELSGNTPSEPVTSNASDADDRNMIRAYWDRVEQRVRDYLADLRDEMLFDKPIKEPDEDRDRRT